MQIHSIGAPRLESLHGAYSPFFVGRERPTTPDQSTGGKHLLFKDGLSAAEQREALPENSYEPAIIPRTAEEDAFIETIFPRETTEFYWQDERGEFPENYDPSNPLHVRALLLMRQTSEHYVGRPLHPSLIGPQIKSPAVPAPSPVPTALPAAPPAAPVERGINVPSSQGRSDRAGPSTLLPFFGSLEKIRGLLSGFVGLLSSSSVRSVGNARVEAYSVFRTLLSPALNARNVERGPSSPYSAYIPRTENPSSLHLIENAPLSRTPARIDIRV